MPCDEILEKFLIYFVAESTVRVDSLPYHKYWATKTNGLTYYYNRTSCFEQVKSITENKKKQLMLQLFTKLIKMESIYKSN